MSTLVSAKIDTIVDLSKAEWQRSAAGNLDAPARRDDQQHHRIIASSWRQCDRARIIQQFEVPHRGLRTDMHSCTRMIVPIDYYQDKTI